MIYRVFSDDFKDGRTTSAQNSWLPKKEIKNIPVKNSKLLRNKNGLPYLKDMLDIGFYSCQKDNDIILYTNSDIGIVTDNVKFPKSNFFCVRKNVSDIKQYKTIELKKTSYENSVNCDAFGVTRKWYRENRELIPDFLIGSPSWDLCILLLINGKRLNNICYHVEHQSEWKNNKQHEMHRQNVKLFIDFCKKSSKFCTFIKYNDQISEEFYEYMANNLGFEYITNPKYIIYSTPSHGKLYKLNYESICKSFEDSCVIYTIEDSNQYCSSATYHHSGWKYTQINKVKSLINILINFRENELFVFCDADIIHLNNYTEEIKKFLIDYDIVAQKSYSKSRDHKYCSGFFAGKKSTKLIYFLINILIDLITTAGDESFADQYYFNKHANLLNIAPLDDNYFSPGYITKGEELELIEDKRLNDIEKDKLNIVHANWIKGVDNKHAFLKSFFK